MRKIYAGIVLYNPDINKLKKNIDAIYIQVSKVLVFDNGSENYEKIKRLIFEYENVELIESKTNLGIAAALNRLMEWGYDNKYEWMISLDQDSICDKDYIKKMTPYLSMGINIGIIAPVIIDRNVGLIGHNPKGKPFIKVNTCITSGAFANILAWKFVNGYDESMFIDSVDFEYCYRLRKFGYDVIQVREVSLSHEIGNSEKRKFLLWDIIVSGHSAFRKYYIAQNNIYYPLKHKLWLHFIRGNFRNIRLLIIVLLYEKNKKEKSKSILKGWKNGFKMNLKKKE